MLSMKSKYAIKALAYMARNEGSYFSSSQMAADENIPASFLYVILQNLRAKGFISAKRGVRGGYFLAMNASDIRLGHVVRLFDGPLAPVLCASRTAYRACDDCTDEANCPVHNVMVDVRDAIATVLDGRTLAEVAGTA